VGSADYRNFVPEKKKEKPLLGDSKKRVGGEPVKSLSWGRRSLRQTGKKSWEKKERQSDKEDLREPSECV